jgi:hypothetical protein
MFVNAKEMLIFAADSATNAKGDDQSSPFLLCKIQVLAKVTFGMVS